MIGINYFQAEPTEFARITVGEKMVGEGEGISRFYLPFRTTIQVVPLSTKDHPFGFQEISKDNQEVNLQGGFIYRVNDPQSVLGQFNLSIDLKTRQYKTEDLTKIPEHLLELARGEARKIIQGTALEKLLLMGDDLSQRVTGALEEKPIIRSMGVEFRSIYFSSVRPKPELAKAFEAKYREGVLQQADEALYARRAAAVEKERAIKENEMTSAQRLENQRKELIALQGANALTEAEYKAKAIKTEMESYNSVDPKRLTALAMLKLGENAGKIGTLTITPEILAGLLNK